MILEELKDIYDQLESVSVTIEPRSIPNPRYISEKIGECHVCIEQVEKIYIKANRELSVLEIALNNAETSFAIARDELISTNPDISNLPSVKEREARANTVLKDQINLISDYKRDLKSLETLVKTLTVKLRNLGRLNGDIRLQMKIMEAQIRLGTGDINDPTTKNLMDELKKTVLGQDVWEGAETKTKEMSIMDASNIDADDLDPMAAFEKSVESMIEEEGPISEIDVELFNNSVIQETDSEGALDPVRGQTACQDILDTGTFQVTEVKGISSVTSVDMASLNFRDLLKTFESTAVTQINDPVIQETVDLTIIEPAQKINTPSPVTLEEQIAEEEVENDYYLPEDDVLGLTPSEESNPETNNVLNLDKVLDSEEKELLNPISGGVSENQNNLTKIMEESTPKETQETKDPNNMSYADLLNQFN